MSHIVAIISHNRSKNVKKMQEIVGECTWFVGEGESESYIKAGANHVIEGGGLCESRNKALDYAFSRGLSCFQLSDDLGRIRHALEARSNKKEATTFSKAVELMLSVNDGFKLVGASPTDNSFFYLGYDSVNRFVLGDFILIRPNELRFDTNLKLKEDYDYTLQHVKSRSYGTYRCDRILPSFSHRTNKGGAVDFRNSDREKEAIDYLKNKWGDAIKQNVKRENEILLNKAWLDREGETDFVRKVTGYQLSR